MKLVLQGQEFEVQPGTDSVSVGGVDYPVRVVRQGDIITVYVNERPYQVQLPASGASEGPLKVLVDAKEYAVEVKGGAAAAARRPRAAPKRPAPPGGAGAITSQMTGRIIRVDVQPGQAVKEGDVLLIVEAMKMENEVLAPAAGTVKEVAVAAGARVSEGDLLVILDLA
jgi:biotin carboxyl carrier protein